MTSRVTMFAFDGEDKKNKMVGAVHGLARESLLEIWKKNGYEGPDIDDLLKQLAAMCSIVVTSEDGKDVREILKIGRFKLQTKYSDTEPHRDLMVIELDRPSKFLKPIRLRATESRQLIGKPAHIVATHYDIKSTIVDSTGKEQTVFPQVKSLGMFRPMATGNPYARYPEIILHDAPTHGNASGALIYDEFGFGVAIHVMGRNRDQGNYDGTDRFNAAIVLSVRNIDFLRDF